jgi:hypothetical protein
VTRLFVSKRRSRAANEYSRVIPAQAGIQCLWLSKRRSRAAIDGTRRRAQAGARRVGRDGRPQGLPSAPASVPAQAGIQRLWASKRRSRAANDYRAADPAARRLGQDPGGAMKSGPGLDRGGTP